MFAPRCWSTFALLIAALSICSAKAGTGSPLEGNRVLVVAPENAAAEAMELAELLTEVVALDTTVVADRAYAPLVDQRFYDGFVYLGSRYGSPPESAFLDDMARTNKPILWIGYHAWLLDKPVIEANGIRIQDQHNDIYDTVVAQTLAPLPATDTTYVEAPARKVLAWLYDPGRLHTLPGVVHVPGFTYLSYFPTLDAAAPDFTVFRRAMAATFGRHVPVSPPRQTFAERVNAARADPFWGGVHLPIYVSGTRRGTVGYDSNRVHDNLVRIADAGAEWVTISQVYYQAGTTGSRIHADPDLTPGFDSIGNIVEDAHKLGLRVRLSPIVNLTEASRGPGEWRGMIRPEDAADWWRAYRDIILDSASFARDHGIESLNIGAELTAMQRDSSQWRELAAAVRGDAGYQGLIGYQVNFDDQAFDSLDWAEALDYVGVAAYWPLAEDRDPALRELVNSWARIGARLAHWLGREQAQRLEFSEIGYASQPYASVLPYSWKPHRGADQSLQEQLTCYRALERFLANFSEVSGVHFFASTTEDLETDSKGYTPFGKPAEKVMKRILAEN